MDVARVAFALVELGHERQRLTVVVGNHLGAALVNGMVITRDQRGVVSERDFLLTEVALALDTFAIQTCLVHAHANVVKQRLDPVARKEVVVDVVIGGRSQVVVPLSPRVAERIVKHNEFELGADIRDEVHLFEAIDLRIEKRSGGDRHRHVVSCLKIGDHHRGVRDPRNESQGRHVRDHRHVVVALFPRRELVPGNRVVFDVDGEQVVAALRTVFDGVFDEEPRRHSLADESTLHVSERDDDRVDFAAVHKFLQFRDSEHAGSLSHVVFPLR